MNWLYRKQTEEETRTILKYIEAHNIEGWYKLAVWKHLRTSILEYYHYECYDCRQRGRITTRPNRLVVHHEWHILDNNNYRHALEPYIYVDGVWIQNLYVLCDRCHNYRHEEKIDKCNERLEAIKTDTWVNEEKW